ncbi:MAG: hypothetical protein NTZ41_10125, partial [Sphingobacteriales bacterium]|nr:hypothetical protein [Sphingobacteriales bacterium]
NQYSNIKSSKINLGRLQATLNSAQSSVEDLFQLEFQVFSQFGDDGIIQYLVNKLPLSNTTFVEFGVEDYRESNTRFLLINNGWSGLVMDGDSSNISSIKSGQLYSFYDLRARQCFITKENINETIAAEGFHPEVGLLSVDIDGNDYWVWQAIHAIQPRIVITEYNSLFGFSAPITIPYQPDFVRGKHTPLNFYGTSLKAACLLAKEKGYFFIGCNKAGNNAYFIHESLRHHSPIKEKTAEEGYRFAHFSESWDTDREPRRGKDKVISLSGLTVTNILKNQDEIINTEAIVNELLNAGKFNGIHF